MSQIPTRSRELVAARDSGRCVRCGATGALEWHHRRRRRESAGHDPHCPCNGVTLCYVCHSWAHTRPAKAKVEGLIVVPWGDPWQVPVRTMVYGWVFLTHDAMLVLAAECEQCGQVRVLEAGLCEECLAGEVCCASPAQAAASGCGCGGGAAQALERLRQRREEGNLT